MTSTKCSTGMKTKGHPFIEGVSLRKRGEHFPKIRNDKLATNPINLSGKEKDRGPDALLKETPRKRKGGKALHLALFSLEG